MTSARMSLASSRINSPTATCRSSSTTGGTGITSRDSTYEAISELIEKRLERFGELFRRLSYHDIGPAAMMSRALAGTARGKIIVALPGSEAGCGLR